MRPTVYLDEELSAAISRYLPEGAPAGALLRLLAAWGIAIMDETEPLAPEQARALLAIARERRLRPRSGSGEPRVSAELEHLPDTIITEALFARVAPDPARQLAEHIGWMSQIERLSLVLRLAWACEAMDLLPGPGRRPLSFDEALRAARLVAE